MEIVEIKNKEQWNKFVAGNGSQFLQSADWGEFQESLGRKVWHLAAVEREEILASALVVKYNLPFGQSYLYIPRGPVGDFRFQISDLRVCYKVLIDKIKEIAKEEKAIFVRIEPAIKDISILNQKLEILNQAKSVQPKDEWRLNLSLSEEELLKNMHSKTRYNIGLATKHGVAVREGDKEKDFSKFWQLIKETYDKKDLKTHPESYYQGILKLANTKLYLAEHEGKVLASGLITYFGDTVYYLHGGSSQENKNIMAPYLLFWETIREAKKAGYKYYNFGGVAPEGSSAEHPWLGITRFKRGFGGEEVGYAGTWDWPINKAKYLLYRIFKAIK